MQILNAKLAIIVVIIAGIAYFAWPASEQNLEPRRPIRRGGVSPVESSQPVTVRGWLPWWDFDNAVGQVTGRDRMNLNELIAFIYIVDSDEVIRSKIPDADERLKDLAQRNNVPVVVSIYNEFDGERISGILRDKQSFQRHIDDLVQLADKPYIAGLEIDYEYMYEKDRDRFSEFISQLSDEIHVVNKALTVTVHPKVNDKGTWHGTAAQDWSALAASADFITIMAYDKSWMTSPPGSIAPSGWVLDVLDYGLSQIPKSKLLLGIPAYGYDWDESESKAEDLTLSDVDQLAENTGSLIETDEDTGSPYFVYTDEYDNAHEVWFENEKSIQPVIDAVVSKNIRGISIWRFGGVTRSYFDAVLSRL